MLIGWMALIFLFSHQPQLPQMPSGWADLILKKAMHATAYGILMGLWWQSLRPQREPEFSPDTKSLQTKAQTGIKTLVMALLFTLLYAITDEWHQTFIPGRHGQFADVLIDFSGALVVFIFLSYGTHKPDHQST